MVPKNTVRTTNEQVLYTWIALIGICAAFLTVRFLMMPY